MPNAQLRDTRKDASHEALVILHRGISPRLSLFGGFIASAWIVRFGFASSYGSGH